MEKDFHTFVLTLLVLAGCMFSTAVCQTYLSVKKTNLTLNGEKVFLSGVNQAWYTYGADFGRTYYAASRPHLLHTLDAIRDSGGNSIRIWLHISGVNTPMFNSSGYVTGLDPNITRDMTDFLLQAQSRNILVTFCLWNGAVMRSVHGLIMDEGKLQSYIDNALIPMVRALRSHRSLGMWEIINEPEGVIDPEVKTPNEPCYDTSTLYWSDFSDWTKERLPLKNLMIFISRQASAIHGADPKALVTVGSWTYKTVTNQLDRRNFYSDECMQYASGGQAGAKLDLYEIHTYDTLFIYLPHDPFLVYASIYKLDKPVIIGEFSQKKGGLLFSPEQFTRAYTQGYSGAWSWCAIGGTDDASDTLAVQEGGMRALKDKNDPSKGGRVNINIQTYTWSSFSTFMYTWLDVTFRLFYFPVMFIKF